MRLYYPVWFRLGRLRVIRDKVVIASGVASPPRALAPLSERAAILRCRGAAQRRGLAGLGLQAGRFQRILSPGFTWIVWTRSSPIVLDQELSKLHATGSGRKP